ncbi:thioredoxin domain-containing protein [Loigolactobacillus zhaoyuanensis]|uniref:Thioredoxin domain-containing protein n=1 Tax=Loigolactobacillus zhaoyuanensis TaxID=2486017 RepID=A0ABW8UIU4_9LACO|nr:thioredoxin domain-containing protein [Loigolactobacillus zhaoyuanensis]
MSDVQFTAEAALNFGPANADHQVVLILNLGCPDSRQWYLNNRQALFFATDSGSIKLQLKFWNKPVADLANGNIANKFIDYSQPKAALAYIDAVYAQQNELNAAVDAIEFIKTNFKTSTTTEPATIAAIDTEVAHNQITSLPTVIFDDQIYAEDTLVPLTTLLDN